MALKSPLVTCVLPTIIRSYYFLRQTLPLGVSLLNDIMFPAYIIFWSLGVLLSLLMVLPNAFAFGSSFDKGLALIDWIYPWPQNHTTFRRHKFLITVHIFFNGFALLLGLYLLHPGGETESSGLLTGIYIVCLGIGSACSICFSARNKSHKLAGTLSFVAMSIASCGPACAVAHARWVEADLFRARTQLTRSVISLFGAGVCFRVLAVSVMPKIAQGSQRDCWIVLIWASWWIPLSIYDLF